MDEFEKHSVPRSKGPTKGFDRPWTVSPLLEKIVGPGPLSRPDVTKKLWAYIHEHNLQDSANRRMINADPNLSAVFGGKSQVSMFEMTALVSKHLS